MRSTRRQFASALPAFLAATSVAPAMLAARGSGQEIEPAVAGPDGRGHKPSQAQLTQLHSGTFSPGAGYGSQANRVSHRYLMGMLAAGNIRLEMHETIQQPGAAHEAVGSHLHNELWLVQRGTAALFINGTEHRMGAGDVGLVTAGDLHWVKNIGSDELAYFVVTLGPPE